MWDVYLNVGARQARMTVVDAIVGIGLKLRAAFSTWSVCSLPTHWAHAMQTDY